VWATYRLYHEFAWAYDVVSWLVSLGHWAGWRRIALDHVIGRRVLEVPCVRGVTQEMPFVGGSFDSIIATFPAGYILDPATLREVARLLRRPDPSAAMCGGRFIVVGLVLDTDNLLLRRATRLIFGTLTESVLARYERIATAAGLRVTVTARSGKGLRIPVIISERCP